MKNLIVFLSFVLLASLAQAWEVKDNPDRFPSVGLNLSHAYLTGNQNTTTNPHNSEFLPPSTDNHGPANEDESSYGADLRLPVASWITVGLSYDHLQISRDFTRDVYPGSTGAQLFKDSQSLTGYRLGLGVRFYLSK